MSVPTATILSQGQTMDPQYVLLSMEIIRQVNRIPDARLVLLDGEAAQRRFAISDTAFFEPGKEIEIKLRYEGQDDTTVFKGLVVRHGVEAGARGSVLTIELKDTAIRLTQPRKSAVFRDQSDDEIIAAIVEDAGLETGDMVSTQPAHAEIVQYYATDWDFIVSRADVQGLIVVAEDGVISLHRMSVSGSPAHSFEYGVSVIYDFEVEIDATHQYKNVDSVAWDIQNQARTEASQAQAEESAQGNLDGGALAEALGFGDYTLVHPVPVEPDELQAWADARMTRSRMSMIRGRLAVPGFAGVKLLDVMALEGIGERFNGDTLITGICHRLDSRGWQTDLQFGLSPAWFCRQDDIQDSPAAGLLPAISGLQVGVVDEFEDDPKSEFRVKVIIPAIGQSEGAVWARLATPDAGAGRGYFFRPEPGDEVVIGFFNNDPRQPVILGAMHSSANAPAEDLELSADNIHKAIITKKGTRIAFVDDDKSSVLIETADSNTIVLDDDGQAIRISDQHGNTITLNEDGIEIKSAKDLIIEATGNVEIKGKSVDVK
jgi:Rhs element Vgr protein